MIKNLGIKQSPNKEITKWLTITSAKVTDLNSILNLHLDLYENHRLFDPKIEIDKEKSRKWIAKKISDPNCEILVIKEKGEIQGYILYDFEKEQIVISEIYLSPSLRKIGLGKKLFSMVLKSAKLKAIRKILTAIPINNKNSLAFWLSLGFRQQQKTDPKYKYLIFEVL